MTDKTDAAIQQYQDASQQVDTDNTIQRIYNTIKDLKKDPDATRKRWIWELLQNAHDARQVKNKRGISVKIKYSKEELVFLHNGKGFNASEIAHVIKSGSTKDETDETTHGQYGTGLLTTHVLSPKIQISGLFKDDSINIWFDFPLMRDDDSPTALRESLDKAETAFNRSFSSHKPSKLGDFTTLFGIPISEEDAKSSVETGIEMLKQCAPYMLIFNQAFHSITIEDHEGTRCFKVANPSELELNVPQQITVTERNNENERERKYLFAKNEEKTSVIVPLESNNDEFVCLGVEQTPRIFKGLPLVDTESYSLPAIINSSKFNVKSTRDSLPLQEGKENKINREIIEGACVLLVALVEHAASNKWHHVPQWVKVPDIKNQGDSGMEWLRERVKKNIIEKIRQRRVVLNADDNAIALSTARLPLLNSENCEGVKILWDLLENVQGFRETLPRRDEAAGWCNAIKSWADIYKDEPTSLFSEVMDGTKLASFIQESTHKDDSYGKIEDLQDLLLEEISAVEWLNQLHYFFNKNGLREAVREHYIVIDQSGFLDKLSALHRDPGIDKELKEIAETLDWSIRQKLRDIKLTSLSEEGGCGDMSQNEVVDILRQKLRNRADENPDDDFKEASKRLFGWVVNKEKWNLLQGFPVFTQDNKSNISPICYLPSAHTSRPLLAPLRAWAKDLEPFKDLFPPERILADAFFEVVIKPDAWKELDNRHLIKSEKIIIDDKSNDLKLFSPEVYEDEDNKKIHEIDMPFCTTDILEWNEIMRNARSNRDNSYLFWRFLTEYIMKKDSLGLEEKSVKCTSCDKYHKYYPAAWLRTVRSNKWIRLGDPHFRADAPSLANLLQNKWELKLLENPGVCNLLQAMSVDPAALKRLFISDEVINVATTLYDSPQLVQHIQDNENLSQDIEKILEVTGGELSQVVKDAEERKEQQDRVDENRDFGKQVENWVKQILEQILKPKGFSVTPKHTGSDFEISSEAFDMPAQEIIQNNEKWLIEVKGTRIQSVKLSFEQTKNALDKGEEFLLCVVPIPENAKPKFETVRENMRFIKNIRGKLGDRVAILCSSIDGQKAVKDDDTLADPSPGINLDFEAGKAGIDVQKSVWRDEGFPLEKLAENLK